MCSKGTRAVCLYSLKRMQSKIHNYKQTMAPKSEAWDSMTESEKDDSASKPTPVRKYFFNKDSVEDENLVRRQMNSLSVEHQHAILE